MNKNIYSQGGSIARRLYLSNNANEKTFMYDESLPRLPVPDLKNTLDSYLSSVRPFCDDEAFETTKKIVQDFQRGIGKELQEKLILRAKLRKNWLGEWWYKYGYLIHRTPLVPYTNIPGVQSLHHSIWKDPVEEKASEYSALLLFTLLEFYTIVREERLRPQSTQRGQHLSMDQAKLLFNTVRIPQKGLDVLETHFKTKKEGCCPQHLIMICNGHVWMVDPWKEDGISLTILELQYQVDYIRSQSHVMGAGPGLGALTCDNRDLWAKNRQWLLSLSSKNVKLLALIETAIGVFSFFDSSPKDITELNHFIQATNVENRWADKSYGLIQFKNGYHGSSCDHTPCDGMIVVVSGDFNHKVIEEELTGSYEKKLVTKRKPIRLDFDVDSYLEKEIDRVIVEANERAAQVNSTTLMFDGFGRDYVKSVNLQADSFIQCAMQLAYYNMHKKLAPTYETAMTRKFYQGRTETVRSCTPAMAQLIQTMVNESASIEQKRQKIIEACTDHQMLMRKCQNGEGIDRHLLGLYLISLENDIPVHSLFTDKSYCESGGGGNYVLSSSTVGYTLNIAGTPPMVDDGYGVFYSILPERILFCFTNYRNRSTCLKGYSNAILSALGRMKQVMDVCKSNL